MNSMHSQPLPTSIPQYLAQLRAALSGADPALEVVTRDRTRIFREGEYPYRKPLSTAEYEALLVPLQAELVKWKKVAEAAKISLD